MNCTILYYNNDYNVIHILDYLLIVEDNQYIKEKVEENIDIKKRMIKENITTISTISNKIVSSLKNNGCIYIFGNGGSAADAQHIAAEFVGRFNIERGPLCAEAFTTNTSILTAVANDYDFSQIFARQVKARVKSQDVVVGISTSGKSKNVLEGLSEAKNMGAVSIGFTGSNANMDKYTDVCLKIPSTITPRIQECHILAWHIICDIVEKEIIN